MGPKQLHRLFMVRERPRDRRVGPTGTPAWAIAAYLEEGLSHAEAASLWRGTLTVADVHDAERAIEEDKSLDVDPNE